MTDLDFNQLADLAALLQTRSVSEAARRRRMSQPAMSRSLAGLRQLFADPLLVRTCGGMMPTRRAEDLAEPLRRLLEDAGRLVAPAELDPARLSRRFRIAATDYGARSALRPALAALHARAPGVTIEVRPLAEGAMAELASGDVDLLVAGFEPDRRLVHERRLFSEELACLVRFGHPLAARLAGDAPRIEDLLAWPRVAVDAGGGETDPLTRALAARGVERAPAAALPSLAAATDLLLESDALAVAPAGAAHAAAGHGLCVLPAPTALGRYDQWLMWHNRSHGDPATRWLVELVAERCAAARQSGAARFETLLAAE